MNDFSFSKVFRAAFKALSGNFTDIFVLSVLASSMILVFSLFLNSVFLGKINDIMNMAMAGNIVGNTGDNPFFLFSFYIGSVFLFSGLVLFFLFSAFMPLCKGAAMKLKNSLPSFPAAVRFLAAAVFLFLIFGIIIVVIPFIAKAATGGDGYSGILLIISAVSFALIAAFVVFALRYVLFFLPLLENIGLKDALIKSYLLTSNRRMKIFVLFAVLFIINYLAKFFIFLMLLTIPFSVLVIIYAYLELTGMEIVPPAVMPE